MQLIKIIRPCILTLYLFFLLSPASAAEPISFNNTSPILSVGKNLEILEDEAGKYDERTILAAKEFRASRKDVPLFPIPVIISLLIWLFVFITSNPAYMLGAAGVAASGVIIFYIKENALQKRVI